MKKSVDKEEGGGYNGDRLARSGTCKEKERMQGEKLVFFSKSATRVKRKILPLENRIATKIRDPERVRVKIYASKMSRGNAYMKIYA